ncbi:MAG: hypothetical protein GX806_02440, partial [Lentisphaerae bacterium]|nr:hypothetical protein [Lentisphaerota bacterium]
MITFEYTGYDAAGRSQKGMIEALDSKQAREKLIQAGILTEWLAPAGDQARRRGFRQPRFSLAQRATFYRELASLLQAGLPLLAALELLIQAPDTGSLRPRLAHIRDKIREGASLSLALDATGELSTHERSILAAGEQAAVLDKVLERLADFMEEQQQLREKIITALIYPAILMLVALGIAIGLLGFAMPRLGLLLTEQTRVAIPGLTRLMIQAGHWVAFWGLPLLAAGALVAVAVWQRLRRDASFLRRIHQRALGLPIIGPGYAILINLRFARTLALLLHGGVSLIDGLVLAGQATGNS